jgi:outer membrane protein OmpA-like peptidoglycan-associated protein
MGMTLLLFASNSFAQGYSITGLVLDKSGNAIDGVTVHLQDGATNIASSVTGKGGRYRLGYSSRSTVKMVFASFKYCPAMIEALSGSKNHTINKVLFKLGELPTLSMTEREEIKTALSFMRSYPKIYSNEIANYKDLDIEVPNSSPPSNYKFYVRASYPWDKPLIFSGPTSSPDLRIPSSASLRNNFSDPSTILYTSSVKLSFPWENHPTFIGTVFSGDPRIIKSASLNYIFNKPSSLPAYHSFQTPENLVPSNSRALSFEPQLPSQVYWQQNPPGLMQASLIASNVPYYYYPSGFIGSYNRVFLPAIENNISNVHLGFSLFDRFSYGLNPITGRITYSFDGNGTGLSDTLTSRIKDLQEQNEQLFFQIDKITKSLDAAKENERNTKQTIDTILAQINVLVEKINAADGYKALPNLILNFKNKSFELSLEARAQLDQFAREVVRLDSYYITVEGFTDSEGGFKANTVLSQKRADAVSNYLIFIKIPIKRIIRTLGYGAARPTADNSTEDGRNRNNRVEIILFVPKRISQSVPYSTSPKD